MFGPSLKVKPSKNTTQTKSSKSYIQSELQDTLSFKKCMNPSVTNIL